MVDRLREVLGSGDRKGAALDRRRFFLTSGVALGVAAVAGGGEQLLRQRASTWPRRGLASSPAGIRGDRPRGRPVPVEGLTAFTENREFYRSTPRSGVPQIRPSDYRLSLTGMFDSPSSYTLPDLFGRDDLIERDVTLTCVSNGGRRLAGTARWLGVPSAPSCGRTASGRAATSSPAGTSTG